MCVTGVTVDSRQRCQLAPKFRYYWYPYGMCVSGFWFVCFLVLCCEVSGKKDKTDERGGSDTEKRNKIRNEMYMYTTDIHTRTSCTCTNVLIYVRAWYVPGILVCSIPGILIYTNKYPVQSQHPSSEKGLFQGKPCTGRSKIAKRCSATRS